MNLDISSTERDALLDVLKQRLGEMREQVYHAEAPRFKDELKQRKVVLENILNKVSTASQASTVLH